MKTFKYSSIVTFILTVLSLVAIFAIDEVIPNISNDQIKFYVVQNLDNFNAFLFGLFTGSLVSLIVAIVGYFTEKNRVIGDVWNAAKKLNIDFKFLLLDNINFENLTEAKLVEIINEKEFNYQVRTWLNYHTSPYMIHFMELDFIINRGKTADLLNKLNDNIKIWRAVVDGFMNTYLNDKLGDDYAPVDIEKVFKIITNQDEIDAFDKVESNLDEIMLLLKRK